MFADKIDEIHLINDKKEVYVKAIAENSKLIRSQTLLDPPEYGPAYVETFISIFELQEFFDKDIEPEEMISYTQEYLKELDYDLDWKFIEDDY